MTGKSEDLKQDRAFMKVVDHFLKTPRDAKAGTKPKAKAKAGAKSKKAAK
ncbi:MAG: hypothetical protein AB7O88_26390 [Reyranellaceae bacterium]